MFSDAGNDVVYVVLWIAEDKRVVDIHDYVCRFRLCDAIEEAIVEGLHSIPFCEEGVLVV